MDPPVGHAGDQIGDAGIAFPPILMGAVQPVEATDELGMGRVRRVPDFMRRIAEGAQHIDRLGIALGQHLAVADAHHLRAARLVEPFLAGNMREVFGVMRIGHVDQGGAIELTLPVERIERLRLSVAAAVMADIGDPAAILRVDGRLIGAAPLQVVIARKGHVPGFRLLLPRCRERNDQQDERAAKTKTAVHGVPS